MVFVPLQTFPTLVLKEAAMDVTMSIETGGLVLMSFVGLLAIEVGFIMIFTPSYQELIRTILQRSYDDFAVTDTTSSTLANSIQEMNNFSPFAFVAQVNTLQ